MKRFPLDKVLSYRSHVRLEKRNALAAAMADEQTVLTQRQGFERQRLQQTAELTELFQQETLDIAAAGRRNLYARRLEAEIKACDAFLVEARRRIDVCRIELVKADQDVKALDRLREKHLEEQTYLENRKTEHELGEQWQAAHWSW